MLELCRELAYRMLAHCNSAACAAVAVLCVLSPVSTAFAGVPQFATCQAAHTLSPLLHEVVPAVVNIAVKGRVTEDNPLYKDFFFRRFLKVPKQLEKEFEAAGSGVIVDADHGYVLANNHVVENASEIKGDYQRWPTLDATLVGRDPPITRRPREYGQVTGGLKTSTYLPTCSQ